MGKPAAFDIEIPQSEAGRIHAGLSWEDIYAQGAHGKLTSLDILEAKIQSFPKFRSFVIFAIFLVLLFSLYLQVTGFFGDAQSMSILALMTSIILFGVALILALYVSYALYAISTQRDLFLIFSRKDIDEPGRDTYFKNFDVDLHCFVFDKNKELLFQIDPTTENLVNPGETICVYHSGEESDGTGAFDDEIVYIETRKLPEDYAYFVYAVSNDCAHDFDKINDLKIRLVESVSDKTLLEKNIDSGENDGYVFCCVYKSGDVWRCQPIEQYTAFKDNWQDDVKALLP